MANPHTGAWKEFERKVARMLHTRRTPLSGKASGHGTSADTLSKTVYAECKWLKGKNDKGAAAFALWEETVANAKKEGKMPLMAMHKRGTRIEFGAIPLDIAADAIQLYLALQGTNWLITEQGYLEINPLPETS